MRLSMRVRPPRWRGFLARVRQGAVMKALASRPEGAAAGPGRRRPDVGRELQMPVRYGLWLPSTSRLPDNAGLLAGLSDVHGADDDRWE